MIDTMLRISLLAATAAALAGCSAFDNCPDTQATRVIETGTPYTDSILLYESAPQNGPFDSFPAKSQVCFVHGLGATPEFVSSEISFSKNGLEGGGSSSENAGNQGLKTCVDDEVIVLKNDTCEKAFYVRVVAIATGESTGSPACDCDRD